MTTATIFGAGNMGSAIAGILASGGADVEHITTTTPGARVNGDIVVLAVPYPALKEVAGAYGDQLAGKIVVDITNPLNFETFDSLTVSAGSSAAAELAAALPASHVVKAFNTNFAATLAIKSVGANPATVLVAGDNAASKETLIAAITAGGLSAIDAGALSRAHELESIGFLQLTLAMGEKIGWTGGITPVR